MFSHFFVFSDLLSSLLMPGYGLCSRSTGTKDEIASFFCTGRRFIWRSCILHAYGTGLDVFVLAKLCCSIIISYSVINVFNIIIFSFGFEMCSSLCVVSFMCVVAYCLGFSCSLLNVVIPCSC